MKHRIKRLLRETFARVLYHTGLHRLVDRLAPRRLTILMGHCVEDAATNGDLPADMKIRAERLERLLTFLGRRYEMCTVGDGFAQLQRGSGRSLVALSMDDGYKDNHSVLLPLLERVGAKATVFVETRPLDERRVNWSHKLFWLLAHEDAREVGRRIAEAIEHEPTRAALRDVLASQGASPTYALKRILKYDAPADVREHAIDAIFHAQGGDDRALCERLYMSWDDARDLAAKGHEVGGHTVNHRILSRLDPAQVRSEIEGSRRSIERELGSSVVTSFAYPFGRRWDFDERAVDAARSSGFACAVTTHPGTNGLWSDPYRLARWPIDDETPLHLIAAEACGGFELLRRIGLDLSA